MLSITALRLSSFKAACRFESIAAILCGSLSQMIIFNMQHATGLSFYAHSRMYFTASKAAMVPSDIAVVSCLYFLAITSPAAKTPGRVVCIK